MYVEKSIENVHRLPSSNTLRAHSENAQRTLREHSENTQRSLRDHSKNTQRNHSLRDHSERPLRTLERTHWGEHQREHSREHWKEHSLHLRSAPTSYLRHAVFFRFSFKSNQMVEMLSNERYYWRFQIIGESRAECPAIGHWLHLLDLYVRY